MLYRSLVTLGLTDWRFDRPQDSCHVYSQIPEISLLFQCNVVWGHFKGSRKSLNDWSDLSEWRRGQGTKKCVCVFLWKREKRKDQHSSVPVSCNSSREVSFSFPQHLHNILMHAGIEMWHTEREINYRKSYDWSTALYHLFKSICAKLTLTLYKENVSGAWSYKSCHHVSFWDMIF